MRNETSKAGLPRKLSRVILTALLGLIVEPFPLLSQSSQGGPLYFAREELTYVTSGSATNRLEKEVLLTDGIRVLTNGTFRVEQGKTRALKPGQSLLPDGTLLNPDGSVGPVLDHVVLIKNRMMVCRDGERTSLETPMLLGDGAIVTPDGFHARPGGVKLLLLDGTIFRLDGRPIQVKDSIMLRGGKVRVQKDGSSFEVPRDSSLMMNEGTKVYGNGRVVRRDGTRSRLKEGDLLLVDGAARKY